MAANSRSTQGIASLGKRLIFNQIWSSNAPSSPALPAAFSLRRAAHNSVYDKNIDDQVCPSVVPDDVIQQQSDKYWAPHPQTGVFGPATEQNTAGGLHPSSPANGDQSSSVLEEKAWFRPTSIEDLEKPPHH